MCSENRFVFVDFFFLIRFQHRINWSDNLWLNARHADRDKQRKKKRQLNTSLRTKSLTAHDIVHSFLGLLTSTSLSTIHSLLSVLHCALLRIYALFHLFMFAFSWIRFFQVVDVYVFCFCFVSVFFGWAFTADRSQQSRAHRFLFNRKWYLCAFLSIRLKFG